MVRRIVTAVTVLAACVAAAVLTAASDETVGTVYHAEFDNAFGLTEGGDLRIGGVNAGQTTGFSVGDSEPPVAIVDFEITEPGFDSLREDAQCDVRQQSLIGEYYVDCQPGTSDQELPPGATIPVEQTSSIIPADLVNNILREPYRERLRLIIAELGTGLAGRPEDLAATIKRAHPGLSQTIQTLKILRGQTQIIKNFVADSDEVIDDLARNRTDVVEFVKEAGETAAITATRKEQLAEQFEKLPVFLDELEPTMAKLGQLADAQIPLLSDLRLASDELNRFFEELGPFSQATLPSLRSLGNTGDIGRRAIEESDEEIRALRKVAVEAGKVGEPLRQFLQTLDDRDRAVHEDTRVFNTDPPRFDRESLDNRRNRGLREKGFTGMEAFLNYLFWQNLSINGFDSVGHFLRAAVIFDLGQNGCSPIATGEPERGVVKRCNSYTGPKQPGVCEATGNLGNQRNAGRYDPDPTERPPEGGGPPCHHASPASASGSTLDPNGEAGTTPEPVEPPEGQSEGTSGDGDTGSADSIGDAARGATGSLPSETRDTLNRARRELGRRAGEAGRTATGGTGGTGAGGMQGGDGQLLDFLLGP